MDQKGNKYMSLNKLADSPWRKAKVILYNRRGNLRAGVRISKRTEVMLSRRVFYRLDGGDSLDELKGDFLDELERGFLYELEWDFVDELEWGFPEELEWRFLDELDWSFIDAMRRVFIDELEGESIYIRGWERVSKYELERENL